MRQRLGTRQMSGVCWYPAKCIGLSYEFKVATRIIYSSLAVYISVKGVFVFNKDYGG